MSNAAAACNGNKGKKIKGWQIDVSVNVTFSLQVILRLKDNSTSAGGSNRVAGEQFNLRVIY